MHILVLHPQKDGSIALLQDHPLVYIIYGLGMAAFFEETARLIFFKWLEKKRGLEKADALAYGLGHGGLELIFLRSYQFDQSLHRAFGSSNSESTGYAITV